MELIQIYDRATGQWSQRYRLSVGYAENWVQDKTTDTGRDFKITLEGLDEPTWGVTDWVRVMHVETPEEAATYTAEGLPLNHTQYIIGAIECKQNKLLHKWYVTFSLIEPIERTRGIAGETLSYTNQTSKTVNVGGTDVTYVKDRYNHYTALRRWLMVTPANCDVYDDDLEPSGGGLRGVAAGDTLGDMAFHAPLSGLMFEETHVPALWFDDGTILASWTEDKNDPTARSVGIGTPNLDSWDGTGYTHMGGVTHIPLNAASFNFAGRKVASVAQSYIRNVLRVPSTNISWYNRIKILDREWLATLPFDDTTFNELSLYNVLMDNYDSSVGRTPVMYFDIDPVTDLPRNLARDEYLLKFERQDGFDKPVLDWDTLTDKAMDLTITKTADNYATGLVSNITNLSAGTPVEYPALNLYAVPEVLDDKVRVTTGYNNEHDRDAWGIKFPHKIRRIVKAIRLEFEGELTTGASSPVGAQITRVNLDITDRVFEKKQYLSAAAEPEDNNNIMWYEEGNDVLHTKLYYFNNDNKTAMFYIEYEPLIDCRVVVGDESFVQQVNQSSSQVDAGKFAGFMEKYLSGMNKADRIFGKTYYNFDAFKDHIGCRVKRGDKTYLITNVSYRNRNLQYDVFYQLNENHLRKNASYQASQEVRPNVEIAMGNIKERKSYIQQTIKLGLTPQTAEGYQFISDKKTAISALAPRAVGADKYPQVALIKTISKLKTSGGTTQTHEQYRLAHFARFVFNDRVVFNTKFRDNAVAAIQKQGVTPKIEGGGVYTYLFKDVQSQIPILYTDYLGENQEVNAKFCSLSANELADIPPPTGDLNTRTLEFNRTRKVYKTMADLPEISDDYRSEIDSGEVISICGLNVYKDMLEAFNLSTALAYKGTDNIIVCAGLAATSRFMRSSDPYNFVGVRFYDTNKAVSDDYSDSATVKYTSTFELTDTYIDFTFSSFGSNFTCKSIVIFEPPATNTKLLIINDVSDTIIARLANEGKLRIYFA